MIREKKLHEAINPGFLPESVDFFLYPAGLLTYSLFNAFPFA